MSKPTSKKLPPPAWGDHVLHGIQRRTTARPFTRATGLGPHRAFGATRIINSDLLVRLS